MAINIGCEFLNVDEFVNIDLGVGIEGGQVLFESVESLVEVIGGQQIEDGDALIELLFGQLCDDALCGSGA